MLGSVYDSDDALQETLLRAWRGLARFQGRSSLRSWLYTIATNVCLTQIGRRSKRVLPLEYGPATDPHVIPVDPVVESVWLEPYPDDAFGLEDGFAAPEARYELRESVELAFIAALQHLAPNQRAVLILREVLGFSARETAEVLETTVASVNSALQRARATLAANGGVPEPRDLDPQDRELLTRYVDAFERYDIDAIVRLLHEDATQHMPPFEMWLRGSQDIATWMLGPGIACRGSRVLATEANGSPAVAQWRPKPDGGFEPWALHVLEVSDGRVEHISSFLNLDTDLFRRLGLPADPDER
jgi:RNA polymerase sigma-70 factor (ECF subfamily)